MNRYYGSNPKVGIRPAIDGRRKGVRESLEAQTMSMARSVASLISSTLKHLDGSPVECVIADACIGGVAEAAMCEEKFQREGVGLSITVTPCWCYGSETMDVDPLRPKAVWGFNGTERPGQYILPQYSPGIPRKASRRSGFTGTMFRIPTTQPSPMM
jgi:L-fucose isomerase